ncbi:MAG: hypothetical protein H6745_30930 [Deltaproteobacteria bacterium]|nr:hypothetical protein [Deltaproteobacteria bacterium]
MPATSPSARPRALALVAALALAAPACADDGDDADASGLIGDCDRPNSTAVATRQLYLAEYGCGELAVGDPRLVTDAAAWGPVRDELAACAGAATGAEPDFAAEYVALMPLTTPMTCGYTFEQLIARAGTGGPYLELEVTDRSAGCEGACAAVGAFVLAVAVPRDAGEAPTFCRRVDPGCP